MTTQINLTSLERAILLKIVNNEYNDDRDPKASTWSNVVCESPSDKAVFGSLVTKGLANSSGRGQDATIYLTPKGQELYTTIMSQG